MFSLALVLAWLLDLYLSSGSAGYTPQPPQLRWHPAFWVAEGICLRRINGACVLGIIILGIGSVIGCLGWIGAPIGLFLLTPLPGLILDFARRDSKFRAIDYVFFNTFKPVSERPDTITVGGRQSEIFQVLYLFIPDKDWDELGQFMDENERIYLDRRRVAGCLFKTEVDADFMLVFDSLRLNRFVVHPENEAAMQAFSDAITAQSKPFSRSSDAVNEEENHIDFEPDERTNRPTQPFPEELPFRESEESLIDSGFVTGKNRDNISKGKGGGQGYKSGASAVEVNDDSLGVFDDLREEQ